MANPSAIEFLGHVSTGLGHLAKRKPDCGSTTFRHWLYHRLRNALQKVLGLQGAQSQTMLLPQTKMCLTAANARIPIGQVLQASRQFMRGELSRPTCTCRAKESRQHTIMASACVRLEMSTTTCSAPE